MTAGGGKPTRILFVNGPSLGRGGDVESRNTRSALIRRLISEKRSRYRQEEEAKRGLLIAQRQAWDRHLASRWCACTETFIHQAHSQEERRGSLESRYGTRTSVAVLQTRNTEGTFFGMCRTCGGLRVANHTQGNTAPALSLSSVSGRADPFSSLDPNLAPDVDSLLQHGQWSFFLHVTPPAARITNSNTSSGHGHLAEFPPCRLRPEMLPFMGVDELGKQTGDLQHPMGRFVPSRRPAHQLRIQSSAGHPKPAVLQGASPEAAVRPCGRLHQRRIARWSHHGDFVSGCQRGKET